MLRKGNVKEKVLTISIASYNTESTLGETLKSLIIEERWMDKLEIIIVNDGSKDSTSEIAHDFAKKYPNSVLVIDKQNGGYGSTINSSLALAKGKYYKLLDGDDWFNTEDLPSFLEYLENTDADLIISPYVEIKADKNLINNHEEIPVDSTLFSKLTIENKLFVMHELSIKTSVIKEQGRKITEHCFYTDAEYVFYCVVSAGTIARFDKPVYLYRLGTDGQSVSLSGIRKHQKDLPIVMNRIVDCHSKLNVELHGAKKEILTLCVCNITYHAYRSFMLLDQPGAHKRELIDLDKELRQKYNHEYLMGNASRLVKLSRCIRFTPYYLLCKLARKIFDREMMD